MPITRPTKLAPGPSALWDWMERRGLNQRQAAVILEVHYMSLNQFLRGVRKPALANALRMERHAGIPVGIWMLTRVSRTRTKKSARTATETKQDAYSHVD